MSTLCRAEFHCALEPGQELPAVIHRRIERTYRLTRAGALELETA